MWWSSQIFRLSRQIFYNQMSIQTWLFARGSFSFEIYNHRSPITNLNWIVLPLCFIFDHKWEKIVIDLVSSDLHVPISVFFLTFHSPPHVLQTNNWLVSLICVTVSNWHDFSEPIATSHTPFQLFSYIVPANPHIYSR